MNILQASLLVLINYLSHYEPLGEVIYSLDCFITFAMTWKVKFAMTKLLTVITRLFIAEVIHKKVILLFWIATLPLAMTMKFNLISFRDSSLLFIKKFITKGDLNYVKSQNNF